MNIMKKVIVRLRGFSPADVGAIVQQLNSAFEKFSHAGYSDFAGGLRVILEVVSSACGEIGGQSAGYLEVVCEGYNGHSLIADMLAELGYELILIHVDSWRTPMPIVCNRPPSALEPSATA